MMVSVPTAQTASLNHSRVAGHDKGMVFTILMTFIHYTPTNTGILSFMQSALWHWEKFNIRCNSLLLRLPATIETDINKEDLKDAEKRRYMEHRSVLGRLGRPEDVAGPAMFLARHVTGASLLVDNFQ